jgi:hypothetical protein
MILFYVGGKRFLNVYECRFGTNDDVLHLQKEIAREKNQ